MLVAETIYMVLFVKFYKTASFTIKLLLLSLMIVDLAFGAWTFFESKHFLDQCHDNWAMYKFDTTMLVIC